MLYFRNEFILKYCGKYNIKKINNNKNKNAVFYNSIESQINSGRGIFFKGLKTYFPK